MRDQVVTAAPYTNSKGLLAGAWVKSINVSLAGHETGYSGCRHSVRWFPTIANYRVVRNTLHWVLHWINFEPFAVESHCLRHNVRQRSSSIGQCKICGNEWQIICWVAGSGYTSQVTVYVCLKKLPVYWCFRSSSLTIYLTDNN